MKITPEHISLATGKQLSRLFGTHENTITAWTVGDQEPSGRLISRAAANGVPKEVLVRGLDLRRSADEDKSRKRKELEDFLVPSLQIHAA